MKRKALFIQIFGWFILLLIIVSPAILSAKNIYGSGNQITLKEEYVDFDRVEISHSFDARLNYGRDYSITLRVDDNLKEHVIVEKKGNTLRVGMKNGHSYINAHLEVSITLPDIQKLGLSGSSSAVISGFEFDHEMNISASGASKIFGSIETGNLTLDLSGASNAILKGRGENLTIHASGSSDVELDEYVVNDARLNLSGASDCKVYINGTMDVRASGSSKVKYCGNGAPGSVETSGFSRVKRM